jgi:hypothetical protein
MTDATMKTAAPTLPTTPPLVMLKSDAVTRSCVTAKILKVLGSHEFGEGPSPCGPVEEGV